jgi:hypothetical protein
MSLWDILSSIGKALYKLFTGDFKGAWQELKSGWKDLVVDVKAGAEVMYESVKNAADATSKLWDDKGPGAGKETPDAKAPPDKGKSRVGDWQQELEKMKAMMLEADGDLATMAQEDERKFWAGKLKLAEKGTEEWVNVRLKMAALGQAINKEEQAEIEKAIKARETAEKAAEKERMALVKLEKMEKIDAARSALDAQKETLEHEVAMGRKTISQKIELLKQYRKVEHDLEIQALNAEQAEYVKGTSQWQALENKKAQAHRKLNGDIAKMDHQLIEDQRQKFGQWFQMLTSGFQSAISGLIKGTMSWGQAVKSVLSSALDSVLNFFVQWGLKEAETYFAGLLVKKTTDEASVLSAASLYAVNAMSSVAAIPFYGWAMAPEVGASAFAEGMAFMPSAAGGWDSVPRDTYAKIHEKEMVMSAPLAEGIRNMVSTGSTSGKAGTGGDTYYVSAMDAHSFESFLHKNRGAVAKVNKSLMRDGRLK